MDISALNSLSKTLSNIEIYQPNFLTTKTPFVVKWTDLTQRKNHS